MSRTSLRERPGRADQKEENMQHYEILIIISSKITEEELPFVIDKIVTLIKREGGEVTLDKNLGKRKLAFGIKQNRYGFYVLLEFNLPPEKLKNMEKDLALLEEVVRYQTVKAKIKTEKELAAEKSRAIRLKEEEKLISLEKEREKVVTPSQKLEEKPPVEPPKKKISLEELDKKLDKILDDDMIK